MFQGIKLFFKHVFEMVFDGTRSVQDTLFQRNKSQNSTLKASWVQELSQNTLFQRKGRGGRPGFTHFSASAGEQWRLRQWCRGTMPTTRRHGRLDPRGEKGLIFC